MHSVFASPDRCRLKENFVRRTTDTNRIVKQLCHACLASVALAMLVTWSVDPCFAQAVDSGLPKDFGPPPPTPKEFAIENPLIKKDELSAWNKKRIEFQDALSGKLAGNAQKIIDEGFRINVHALSLVEHRDELTSLRKKIIRYIDVVIPAKNVATKQFASKTVIKHALPLLDGNFLVRMHAVQLIGELNVSPQVPGIRPTPPVAYVHGLPVLLDVIHPPEGGVEQPEPVRILAALGARHLLERGRHTLKINSKVPADAVKRMLAQLEGDGIDWYHQRLIEAMVHTALATVPNEQNQQEPLIVEALARILANPRRSNQIRARAARLLGRTPMPGGQQSAPIAYVIVKLTQKIATEVNQKRLPVATALFQFNDIYLAFVPEKKGESTTDGRKVAGLKSTLSQQPIQAAYKDILPVVASLFQQVQDTPTGKPLTARINPALISKLNDWPKPDDMALSAGRVSILLPMRKPKPATSKKALPQARRQGNNANSAS